MVESKNEIVSNALGMTEARELAEILKSKPWNDPKYRAEQKARLESRVRERYGEKTVKEWEDALKKAGWWRG